MQRGDSMGVGRRHKHPESALYKEPQDRPAPSSKAMKNSKYSKWKYVSEILKLKYSEYSMKYSMQDRPAPSIKPAMKIFKIFKMEISINIQNENINKHLKWKYSKT